LTLPIQTASVPNGNAQEVAGRALKAPIIVGFFCAMGNSPIEVVTLDACLIDNSRMQRVTTVYQFPAPSCIIAPALQSLFSTQFRRTSF
jgi:hypothetical protein